MFKFQRKLAILTVPAVLALGAVSYGTVVGFASPTPSPIGATAPSASEPAESTTAAEAAEATEPNEPALPGGGYADAANTQADTQQEGVN